MMRYFLALILIFSLDVFATNPCGKTLTLNPNYSTNPIVYTYISCSNVDYCPTQLSTWTSDCTLSEIYTTPKLVEPVDPFHKKWEVTRTVTYYLSVDSCPAGETPNENGVCTAPPPPTSCSWATNPPWWVTGEPKEYCSNTHKNPTNDLSKTSYLWNFTWCEPDQKCYAREYYCPKGQQYDSVKNDCVDPSAPPYSSCREGFYKQSGSTTSIIDGTSVKTCYVDFICKSDPNIRYRKQVSCGAAPVDDAPETYPTDPVPDLPTTMPTTKDHSTKCGTDRMMAEAYCEAFPNNVLSFKCDPLTGISSYTCKPRTETEKTPIEEGDSTKGSTTEDIKNLANDLPDRIRDALKDFFIDGGSNLLQSISGSLQASTILQSDANDKLDSISASTDAGLILQSDANEKLDGIKSSVDGVKDALSGGEGTYTGDSLPTEEDLTPDETATDGFDTFTNSITSLQDQFNQAQAVFSGGVPLVAMGSGSCPSYSFMGHSVSLSKIGQSISPYSSIFSILIYISLMIGAFRLVFGFFSRGV